MTTTIFCFIRSSNTPLSTFLVTHLTVSLKQAKKYFFLQNQPCNKLWLLKKFALLKSLDLLKGSYNSWIAPGLCSLEISLLEGNVLHDGRQLVMISNHNPSLQSAAAILRILSCKPTFKKIIVSSEGFKNYTRTVKYFDLQVPHP